MDIKKILESLDQLSEATKETPTGKIHKAEPGGYGRKFDTDEEGDEDKKDKKKKAEPAEKRGRGRPPKEGGESDKKSKEIGQSTKALQSFMVGNLPKGKLPGKATTKHTLKDWIEIVKENQNVSVEPLKQQSSVVKKNGEVVAQVDDPNLARQIQQGLSSGKMSISGEQGMDEAASYKPSGRVRTQEIYDKEGHRLGGIIIDYDLDPDHWEAFTITKTGQLGKRQKFKDTGEAIRWVRSNSFMSSQSPVKEEGVMEGSEEKPPRMTHTCEKCGKKWQLQHHCKGAPNKKQGVAEATGDSKFDNMLGNIVKDTPMDFVLSHPISGVLFKRGFKSKEQAKAYNQKKEGGYYSVYSYQWWRDTIEPGIPDFYRKKGVAEGFSDVVKGIKRSLKGKEHPDVVASKHAGRAMGHYNQGDIAAGDKETKRYVKTRDMHLKAKGVTEGQLDELKKSTVKSYADKKQAELDDVPPMPFKKPTRSKAEIEKDAKGMMGALSRLSGKKPTSEGVTEGKPNQLPTQGADYSKYDTDHLRTLLKPGILHRNEARFKALIRKELKKREQQGVAEGVSAQDKNISVGDYVQTAAGVEGVVKHISPDGKKLTIWNRKRQADHRVDITKAEKIPGIARRKMAEQGVAEGSYREGGSITHDGVEYDFDSVMSIAEKLPTKTCSVDKLSWVLKYDTPDEHRVKKADISVPLIVTKSVDGKLAAIDGLHRLAKAVRDNVKTLPVKYIKPGELESAKLNKQGVAEGLPGSSQIYDQIESLSDKLKHTSDPDKRRFYVKQIKKLEHKLHSTDDPFDIDDPAPIGKKGVAEGMDPEKRTRLDDLIDQFSDATDPSDYGNDNDPEDVIAMIRAEFGDKIADQVASGAEKMHFGHHPHQRSDPLAWKTYRGKNRVTKGGKLFKQDSDYLKNTIKSRYKLSGKSATEGVAEADMPTDQGDVGAGLGAGRSQTTLEDTNSSIFKGTQLAEASRK